MSSEQDQASALCKDESIKQLKNALKALADADDDNFADAAKRAREDLEPYAKLHALLSDSAASTLDSFLSEVGSAAVTTQRRLDVQNRQALEEARALGLPPSSVFQLPKLSATVKFAISKTEKQRFGLVFASKSSGSELTNEQTLSFDIVSVPLSPELIRSAKVAAETTQPILDEDIREQIKEVFAKAKPQDVTPTPDARRCRTFLEEIQKIVLPDFDRALVVRQPRDDNENVRFLVFYAAPQSKDAPQGTNTAHLIGIWEADIGTGAVIVVWSYKSGKGEEDEDYQPFQRWVQHLAAMQLAVLKPNQG